MTNRIDKNDSLEYLYAFAVLTRLFTTGIITPRVFETAVKKARQRFDKNSFAERRLSA
jgi:hypothetical protein